MSKRKKRVPGYRLHRASGLAVVTIRGRDIYLGEHGSEESNAEYDRIIAEYLAGVEIRPPTKAGKRTPATLTVRQLTKKYVDEQSEKLGNKPNASQTLSRIRLALAHADRVYGHTPAAEFGPLALKVVRKSMLDADLARSVINERVWRIRRVFRWAVEEQLVPLDLAYGLEAIENLKAGEFGVRPDKVVRPVAEENMRAVLPQVSRQIQALILLQYWTGARSGELIQLCPEDLDRSGSIWVYRPKTHKTKHRGKIREIGIDHRGQDVLRPFLNRVPAPAPSKPLFSPREAEAERLGHDTRKRASKNHAGQPRDSFTSASYRRAIDRAIRTENRERITTAILDAICPLVPNSVLPHFEKTIRALPRSDPLEHIESRIQNANSELAPDSRIDVDIILAAARGAGTNASLVPRWHPHQLRHAAGTRMRKEIGLENTRIALGHSSAAVTEWYAEIENARVWAAMERIV